MSWRLRQGAPCLRLCAAGMGSSALPSPWKEDIVAKKKKDRKFT